MTDKFFVKLINHDKINLFMGITQISVVDYFKRRLLENDRTPHDKSAYY